MKIKKKDLVSLVKYQLDMYECLLESYELLEKLESMSDFQTSEKIRKFLVEKGIWEK